jgi:hypothetical protein
VRFLPSDFFAHDHTRMKMRLLRLPMTALAAISFLCTAFPPNGWAQITATTDESGRTIYINGDGNGSSTRQQGSSSGSARLGEQRDNGVRTPLMYWSVTEHRFKPVPTNGAVMRAARTAASEVNHFFAGNGGQAINRAFRQEDIDAAIDVAAERHHVDPSLVRSVVKVESNFNPNAVSRKGAMGLMQLMPATARSLNVANPFDPAQNVDAGVRHLRQLLDSYGGNVQLTLAAYNAGSGAVARSAGIPRFRETQNYVRRITDLYNSGGAEVAGGEGHHAAVKVERDARGVLTISNTE